MKCPKCQHENKSSANFCARCGTKLQGLCPQCKAEISFDDSFCSNCGASLETTAITVDSSKAAISEAERRQLTVMFCDLVGSTPLSEQLDPEELREVIKAYQQVCSKVINRFEGHIAIYFGDGLLVYFGYPIAHEDDAHRAVRTGLGIIEAIGKLNSQLQTEKNIRLAVRLGIHTGIVVAGDIRGEAGERLESMAVMGETPNLAARLQGLAEPDTLVISAMTYRLIQGFFDCQALGSQSLRGISQPIELYRVFHESTARIDWR